MGQAPLAGVAPSPCLAINFFWKSGKHLNVLDLRAAMSFPVS